MDDMKTMYIEIDPIDKMKELCDFLIGHPFEIHKADDGEYNYLDEESICITVLNPYSDRNKMFIDLDDEFTLTYNAFHCHYSPYLHEYEEMKETIAKFLGNEICSASLYYGENRNWLASDCISKEESLVLPIKKLFSNIFKSPEFKKKLNDNGGEAHFCFWNPIDDSVIKINKKE